jgi:hypothetical protein
MIELDLSGEPGTFKKKAVFGDHMINAKENGVLFGNHVYVGGYGYQLGSYVHETGEIIGLAEYLPDYTKAFAARHGEDGLPILLVGGRSGFINAYRIQNGVPFKVREWYIQ